MRNGDYYHIPKKMLLQIGKDYELRALIDQITVYQVDSVGYWRIEMQGHSPLTRYPIEEWPGPTVLG